MAETPESPAQPQPEPQPQPETGDEASSVSSVSTLLPLPVSDISRFSELCELFTTPRRAEIIHILSLRPSTPSEINSLGLKLSFSGVSQHLSKLESAGMIEGERNAQSIRYKINPQIVEEFKRLMDTVLPVLPVTS